jgi:hypothetical protein
MTINISADVPESIECVTLRFSRFEGEVNPSHVIITGDFAWPYVPPNILLRAIYLLAKRLYKEVTERVIWT